MPLVQIGLEVQENRGRFAQIFLPKSGEQASFPFKFSFSPQDREDVRWYLEDYARRWQATSNPVVDRIRRVVEQTGAEIFEATLGAVGAASIWKKIKKHISETRIEIRDGCPEIGTPWELITMPTTGARLSVHAAEFVRVPVTAASPIKPRPPGPIRILLIISRPEGVDDIAYWSVARDLRRTIESSAAETTLTVLRPPTFAQLERALQEAASAALPYDVVHFDGHGLITSIGGARPQGYLQFQGERSTSAELIDGRLLGGLLADAHVKLLVMNACRSGQGGEKMAQTVVETDGAAAFPSLSERVLAQGVPAVVGMRHSIYPATAQRYFAGFYERLLVGDTVGRAGVLARRKLFEDPFRPFRRDDLTEIEDWSVPFVGEAAPLVVADLESTPRRRLGNSNESDRDAPDFVSRDDLILTIDHHLASGRPVLIHGPIASGKTRMATELKSWYAATGGIGSEAFLQFSASTTPGEIEAALRRVGVKNSAAATPSQRSLPKLVIFDQVDVMRRESGSWSEAKAILIEALQNRRDDLRILLTSCSSERDWLPEDVARVMLPPLSMWARRLLAEQWVPRHGGLFDFSEWRSVLRFRGGYPGLLIDDLHVSVELQKARKFDPRSVVQTLSDGAWDRFPARASAGHRRLDKEVERRLNSAVPKRALKLLPHIHLFQTVIEAGALLSVYEAVRRADVPKFRLDDVREVLSGLQELGLLNPQGVDQWTIHPALVVASARSAEREPKLREPAVEAYTRAIAAIGSECELQYRTETEQTVRRVILHESNFLNTRIIASRRDDWATVAGALAGVFTLYRHDGMVFRLRDIFTEDFGQYIDRKGQPRRDREAWAQRFWDWCSWIHYEWGPQFASIRLIPADGDFYGRAILLRRVRRAGVVEALRRELDEPFLPERYSAGDVAHMVAEQLAASDHEAGLQSALLECRSALRQRHERDLIGRIQSLILEANIHLRLVDADPDNRDGHINAARRSMELANQFHTFQLTELDAALDSAWSTYWLERGDVEEATSYFQSFATQLQELHAYSAEHAISFARRLEARGWVQRALDIAAPSFLEFVQAGDHGSATAAREYIQALKTRLKKGEA